MNINLRKFVENSNFEHYYFITDAKYFKEGTVIETEYKGDVVKLYFNQPDESKDGYKYYDLGKCITLNRYYVQIIASWIEHFKIFAFDNLEVDFETKTAYIHLRKK